MDMRTPITRVVSSEMAGLGADTGFDWGGMIGGIIKAGGDTASALIAARQARDLARQQPIAALPIVNPNVTAPAPAPNPWPWVMGVAGIGVFGLIAVSMLRK